MKLRFCVIRSKTISTMVLPFLNVRNMMHGEMSLIETCFYVPETDARLAVLFPEQEASRLSSSLESFDSSREEAYWPEPGGWAHLHGVAHEGSADHYVDVLISFPGMIKRGIARLRGREPNAVVHLRMD